MKFQAKLVLNGPGGLDDNSVSDFALFVVDGTELPDPSTSQPAPNQNILERLHHMKKEHKQILAKLYEEIDKLKRQNQRLQLQIALGCLDEAEANPSHRGPTSYQKGSPLSEDFHCEKFSDKVKKKNSSSSNLRASLGSSQRFQYVSSENQTASQISATTKTSPGRHANIMSQKREFDELRHALQKEKQLKCQLIEKLQKEDALRVRNQSEDPRDENHDLGVLDEILGQSDIKTSGKNSDFGVLNHQPLDITVDSFLMRFGLICKDHRLPAVHECEALIKMLRDKVSRQGHELHDIRTNLNDVLSSEKWTPESYLLAKYYTTQQFSANCGLEDISGSHHQTKSSGKIPHVVSLPVYDLLPPLQQTARFKMTPKKVSKIPTQRYPYCEL